MLEYVEAVLHPELAPAGVNDTTTYCFPLEEALDSPGVRREDVPGLQEAASRCVTDAIRAALKKPSNADKRRSLEELEMLNLVMNDEDRKRVREAIEKLPKEEPPPPSFGVWPGGTVRPDAGGFEGGARERLGSAAAGGDSADRAPARRRDEELLRAWA